MRPVTESIHIKVVPDSDRPQYYDAIHALIERNRADYIPWKEYAESDGTPMYEFFSNYRATDEYLLVAEDTKTDTLCGFATIDAPSEREDIPVSPPFTYYSLMLVDRGYRGNGIGTAFYDTVLSTLLPALDAPNPVVIGTWESNKAQQSLLDKFGFERFDSKQNHRSNGEDTYYYRTHY